MGIWCQSSSNASPQGKGTTPCLLRYPSTLPNIAMQNLAGRFHPSVRVRCLPKFRIWNQPIKRVLLTATADRKQSIQLRMTQCADVTWQSRRSFQVLGRICLSYEDRQKRFDLALTNNMSYDGMSRDTTNKLSYITWLGKMVNNIPCVRSTRS